MFPFPGLGNWLIESEWVDAKVVYQLDNQNLPQGQVKMTGTYRTEYFVDENGMPVPESEQYKPSVFGLKANFVNGKLDGSMMIKYMIENEYFGSEQLLFKEGRLLAFARITIDDMFVQYNLGINQRNPYFNAEEFKQ